jgi:hypothetical protein
MICSAVGPFSAFVLPSLPSRGPHPSAGLNFTAVNVVQIITETGLRVYKELAGIKKDQVGLSNEVVFIADSKTPAGVAEVPLTDIAVEAFRN